MRTILMLTALLGVLSGSSCSQAQSEDPTAKANKESKKGGKKDGKKGKKNKEDTLENRFIDAAIPGLSKLATFSKVPESSSLALGEQPGTFYTNADAGNSPTLYKVNTEGKLLQEINLPVANHDWESLAKDDKGNLYVVDAGNNNNSRKNLVVYRVNPTTPQQVSQIPFSYADQTEFPPKKTLVISIAKPRCGMLASSTCLQKTAPNNRRAKYTRSMTSPANKPPSLLPS